MKEGFVGNFLYESRFWLRILRDHTVFMFDSFSPSESQNIQTTLDFMKKFDTLLKQVMSLPEAEKDVIRISKISDEIFRIVCSFLEFQQLIMKKRMLYEVNINMTPTFLEHMIREGKEYLRQLDYIKAAAENEAHSILNVKLTMNQHKLWQPDAAGHAAYIQGALDMTEKPLIEKARMFQKDFENLFFKTYELKTMLHPHYPEMPQVIYLNEQSTDKITDFVNFLDHIKELIEQKKVMSMLNTLIPDHMKREEAYYISKLKMYMPKS